MDLFLFPCSAFSQEISFQISLPFPSMRIDCVAIAVQWTKSMLPPHLSVSPLPLLWLVLPSHAPAHLFLPSLHFPIIWCRSSVAWLSNIFIKFNVPPAVSWLIRGVGRTFQIPDSNTTMWEERQWLHASVTCSPATHTCIMCTPPVSLLFTLPGPAVSFFFSTVNLCSWPLSTL